MELVACIPLLNHPSKLKPTKLNHQLPASEFAQNPPLQCLHQSHNQTRHSHPIKSSNWPSSSTLIFASSHWTAKSPIKSSCELPPLSLVQPHHTPSDHQPASPTSYMTIAPTNSSQWRTTYIHREGPNYICHPSQPQPWSLWESEGVREDRD